VSKFNYVALDSRGKETKGSLSVGSQEEAIACLKEMGLFPTKVIEANKTKRKPDKGASAKLADGERRPKTRLGNVSDEKSALEVLAEYAMWTRPKGWTEYWFACFLTPLYLEGLFLPPLFAYEICSAAERGERCRGLHANDRQNSDRWLEFNYWLHDVIVRLPAERRAAKLAADRDIAKRCARLFALHLMGQFDLTGIRDGNRFEPEKLLQWEANRLTGGGSVPELLNEIWNFYEEAVETGALRRYLPASELLNLAAGPGAEIDPFLSRLLELDNAPAAITEPQIRGVNSRADNPRKILSPVGEFAKRDLDRLPDELGRLAPIELLLYQMSRKNAGTDRKVEQGFKTLFLMRVADGHLLQRMSHDTRPAQMQPAALFQVEFGDDPELHQLSDPPHAPIISWYRALAVELVHRLAALSIPFRWSVSFLFNYQNGERSCRGEFDMRQIGPLAAGSYATLKALVAACPNAFTAAWPQIADSRGTTHEQIQEVDYWMRIALGVFDTRQRHYFAKSPVRALHEKCVRVEKSRDGSWGVASGEVCAEVLDLKVKELDQRDAPLREVSQTILLSAFGANSTEETASNAISVY